MASSLSHLTTLDTCHADITTYMELEGKIFIRHKWHIVHKNFKKIGPAIHKF